MDPALQPVTQAIVLGLPPAPVTVERGRAEVWERRRGRPAAWDARWRQAMEHPAGQGWGEVVGPRQEAV